MKKTLLRPMLCLLAAGLPFSLSWAQGYPTQPIRMVVPFAAGGITDITARMFAEGLAKELGQTVVVENRTGAGGSVAAGAVANAKPDGYTLLVITNGMYAVNPLIYKKLPYDPKRDFTYVALLANTPTILAVAGGSSSSSLKELLEKAAAQPDKVSFATAGEGSDSYQVLQLLQQIGGVKMLHVPYKGGSESMTSLLSGNVDMTAVSAVPAVSFVKSGQIRPLAVTSSRRLPNLPEIPTVGEVLGKPLEGGSLSGIAVPAGTPAEIVKRLNAAIAAVAKGDAVRQNIYARGSEPVDGTQEAFVARVAAEQKKWEGILGSPAH
ncbi:tripartite tricarboxylate transporter substrate binding protein [Pigmentiphaga sp. H8]|uniref:Bug family tripartite tricarboxylate transporter substrate binding protein n=1 Tax=unclassified Pigmentiphaga TaxID=2626614 RepID=UPI000F5A6A2A|nr:tripartite tricarboxylate transporter substrate binding protein [Pigmentiphaga sp. H8]AZG10986.1 tripartite tricarboxylate transporter substrate binding protein [Pigmentiphaga sp. H8]